MSGSVRDLLAADAGLEVVCDLPESHGYRRWLVVGHLAQDARELPSHVGERVGYSIEGEFDLELPGLVVTRAGHGA